MCRLNENEGQNSLLRSRVERAERERRDMQTRVSQTSQGGVAAFNAQELQRQLDTVRQQLAFKEQEVKPKMTQLSQARPCVTSRTT